MPELRYLASARSDLKSISDYITKASANPASVPCKGYIIFFRYRDNFFEVINIVQSHRDLPSLFRDKT